jgi:membrane protein required for colicin V production
MEVSEEMMRIGLVDGIIAAVIVASTIYSLVKGFIKELFLIIAVLAGAVMATKFYLPIKDSLLPWIHNSTIATIIGFLLPFFLVALLVVIVGNVISKLVHTIRMGLIDRLLGGILGIIKGVLICGIACMILLTFVHQGEELLRGSALAPGILTLTSKVFSLLPEDVRERFQLKLKHLTEPPDMVQDLE